MTLTIEKTANKKPIPSYEALGFGKYFSDHMFVMDFNEKQGWHDARIVPYAPIALDPAAVVFHYGQALFEGMKAYKSSDNEHIYLFRPEKNFERLNRSCERICIPTVDVDFMVDSLKKLIEIDKEWIPCQSGTCMYIRPFVIGTEAFLGVHPAKEYKLLIIMSPSAAYGTGLTPDSIMVEKRYVRAVVGGTGTVKVAGNYAASLLAQSNANAINCSQVLWLDGIHHKYIEEVGSMNIFFKINGKVITPELSGSILPGITRMSVIELCKSLNIPVEERHISIDEVAAAYNDGTLEECFGSGTAAVISPVGKLVYEGKEMIINNEKIGNTSQKLYDILTGIQYGRTEDPFNWRVEVK